MTSVHMNSSEAQTTNSNNNNQSLNGSSNNQSQSPAPTSKYDEAERARQRMEEWRRHHAEMTEVHNRTQPRLDEQIHDDTIKYLKNNPVNGTKTKSQKPRAPKRQRTTANVTSTTNSVVTTTSNNNSISANSTPGLLPSPVNSHGHLIGSGVRPPPGSANHLQHSVPPRQQQIPPIQQQQQQQPQPQHIQQQQQPQPQHIQQPQVIMQPNIVQTMQPNTSAPYQSTHMQQPPVHMQQQQQHQQHRPPHQNQVSHQAYNGNYQPSQYQTPPINYPQQQQQQHQHMHPVSHNQHMQATNEQVVHYDNHQGYAQPHQNHHGYYHTQQPAPSGHQKTQFNVGHHNHVNQHNSYSTLPNDLDLNLLQTGLECDVDSLIKHEMSVEGQLDFNNELLLKLDNIFQPNNHHHQHQ